MQYSIIDTFTDKIFFGSQAAVFLTDKPLNDKEMPLIAKEINLTNVAFLYKGAENCFHYRCFFNTQEIIEPSHGLLAAAYYLRLNNHTKKNTVLINNNYKIPILFEQNNHSITLRLPTLQSQPIKVPDRLAQALNKAPIVSVHQAGSDCLVELYHRDDVLNLKPDFNRLKKLDFKGIIVTSEGDNDYDFVYRYFSTSLGINEDQVNIESLCRLVPFWHNRLHKNDFNILQMSQRQGKMLVNYDDTSLLLTSTARESFSGNLFLTNKISL